MLDALNKLCKWRAVLAGWHHGTQSMTQPGTQAMRDLMDKWLIMRVEVSAMTQLCMENGVFTAEQFRVRVEREARMLDKAMEEVFPGMRTSEQGVVLFDAELAHKTMLAKGFPP
jgi:hypothetical protein